jgi:hypothetical protein
MNRYQYKKKFELIEKELLYFLPKQLLLSSQKFGLGILDQEKTYPGSIVANPDPGSGAFWTPGPGFWIRDEKMSESGINISDLIFENVILVFGSPILKFFDADPGSGILSTLDPDPR